MTVLQTSAGFQPRTTNGGTPMPLPTPSAGESRDDFVARCMKDAATQDIMGDSPENTQARRVAACERQFTEAKAADLSEALGMKAVGAFELGDTETGAVSAVVATLGEIDHDGEIIAPDAIPDGIKVMMSSYNHNSVMGQMLGTGQPDEPPVGKGAIHIEGNKAIYRGNYFMETARGKEAYLTTKALGADAKWSFAYGIEQTAKPPADLQAKGARRILVKLRSLPGEAGMEVSPVNMPGGKGTGTVSLKASAPLPAGDPAAEKQAADLDATVALRLRRMRLHE